jgi:hypothetical protein
MEDLPKIALDIDAKLLYTTCNDNRIHKALSRKSTEQRRSTESQDWWKLTFVPFSNGPVS